MIEGTEMRAEMGFRIALVVTLKGSEHCLMFCQLY
jgi:hypothetical protein